MWTSVDPGDDEGDENDTPTGETVVPDEPAKSE